jgi:hypothetical protein
MKAKVFVCVLALLSSMASAGEPFSCDSHFEENLQIITEQLGWFGRGKNLADMGLERGDFNGDGLKDKVVVLRLNKATKLDDGVTLLNLPAVLAIDRKPGNQAANTSSPALPASDMIALGIIQSDVSDKKCRKFVIYDTSYFSVKAEHLYVKVFL